MPCQAPICPSQLLMLHASGLIYIAHLAHLSYPKGHRVLHYIPQPPTLIIYLLSTSSFSRDIPETRDSLAPCSRLSKYLVGQLSSLSRSPCASPFGSSHPPGADRHFAFLLASPHNLRHPTSGYLTTTLHIFLCSRSNHHTTNIQHGHHFRPAPSTSAVAHLHLH